MNQLISFGVLVFTCMAAGYFIKQIIRDIREVKEEQ